MAGRLTVKALSVEVEALRKQIQDLEQTLRQRIERLDVWHSASLRRQYIAERAYCRAEQRGFTGGNPEQDWLEAEREVDAQLLQQTRMITTHTGDEQQLESIYEPVYRLRFPGDRSFRLKQDGRSEAYPI